MQCPHCQHENRESAKFCAGCGSPLAATCAPCGNQNPPGAAFCDNSGEVVVRTIGNDLHMDYSAVGPTTHLAARMEQLATPGSIMLTATTFRLVEGLVRVNARGPVPVKGMTR
jgi:class 3 adenylate cyclase